MVNWKKLAKLIPINVTFGRNAMYEIAWIEEFKDLKTLGETRFEPNQIVIKTKQTPRMTVITYLHECLHAISNECGANLTEPQILALEKAIYYVLKSNNVFKDK